MLNYGAWEQQAQLPCVNHLIPLAQVLVSPSLCEAFGLASGLGSYDTNPYCFSQPLESQPRFTPTSRPTEKPAPTKPSQPVLKSELKPEKTEISEMSGQQQVPTIKSKRDAEKMSQVPLLGPPPPHPYPPALAAPAPQHLYLSPQHMVPMPPRHRTPPYPYGPPGQPMLLYPRDAAAFGLHGLHGQPPYPGGFPGAPFDYPQSCTFPAPDLNVSSATVNGSDDEYGDDVTARALKRPRLVWTPQLHRKFEEAISRLGPDKAVPKNIMQDMNVEGLTRENVASHLQKYRLQKKKESSPGRESEGDGDNDDDNADPATSKTEGSESVENGGYEVSTQQTHGANGSGSTRD